MSTLIVWSSTRVHPQSLWRVSARRIGPTGTYAEVATTSPSAGAAGEDRTAPALDELPAAPAIAVRLAVISVANRRCHRAVTRADARRSASRVAGPLGSRRARR